MEKKNNFLRNWLSLISNPKSNVIQVLQDRFQSKLDDHFLEEDTSERKNRVLYPSKNMVNENKDCHEVKNENGADKHYQDEDGTEFKGRITMRKQKKVRVTEDEIDAMIKDADYDVNGKINYDEFALVLTEWLFMG